MGDAQRARGQVNGRSALRVAILGGGPAGSALALLLACQGTEVTLFDDGRRPELLVGESLVPAVIPILTRLGVEQNTASVGLLKPGVSFIWSPADRFAFSFARFAPAVPPYAYNIPRPQFDEVLLDKAVVAGAHRVVARARLERAPANDDGAELVLAADTLDAAPSLRGRQPDLIVDATGRARQAARTLHIPARVGPRDDIAHFAHFEGFQWDEKPGQVLIARLQAGWSWRIPLKDRLSVGIVLGREDAARLGRTPEERLERAIARDPWLSQSVGGAKRVTSVASYSNYQLISTRASGPGWVTVGDAFGFIDPMLSPGVFLALRSAELVADALAPFARGREIPRPGHLCSALGAYTADQAKSLAAWLELVDYFYDGRMLALLRAGRDWMQERSGFLTSAVQQHIERHVALQATGVGTTARYSRTLLRFIGRYGLRGVHPADFTIR
jgi:flavin-dependent dehydrogenase